VITSLLMSKLVSLRAFERGGMAWGISAALILCSVFTVSCQDRSGDTLKMYEFFKSEFESREKKFELSMKIVTDSIVRLEGQLLEMKSKRDEEQKALSAALTSAIDSEMASIQQKLIGDIRVELQKGLSGLAAIQPAATQTTGTAGASGTVEQPVRPPDPNRRIVVFPGDR